MRRRSKYEEGTWFAVPLGDGGFAVGVVARANRNGVLMGYFFGPRRPSVPLIGDMADLRTTDPILVKRFGYLGLKGGEWPLLGRLEGWDREQWPMPIFGRFEELTGRSFAVRYAADDPSVWIEEWEIDKEELARYPSSGLAGHGYIEDRLTMLLPQS